MTEYTIDTNVLYKAVENNVNAVAFLAILVDKSYHIVLDSEGHIRKEYEKCIATTKTQGSLYIQEWFIKVMKNKLLTYQCGKLDNAHSSALKKLKFHNDDFPFVAVCYRSNDKILMSVDSDYNIVKDYLLKNMFITVRSINDISLDFSIK